MRLKSALFHDYPAVEGDVFGQGRRERIADLTDLYPHVVTAANFDKHAPNLAEIEVIFATWGFPRFTDHHFAQLPKLKAVFYAAGNVRAFADALVARGIVLVSAWDINAIATSEVCLAEILLSLRGYYRNVRLYAEKRDPKVRLSFARPGINGETVGLIGFGKIATRLRNRLSAFPLKVIVFDPFLSPERAAEMHVERVSLDDVFRRAYVVSNHIPNLPSTQGVLTARHFESMRDGATFVNSGRGAQVVEADLIRVMAARPDLTALLDVTDPEPPVADSPLWSLPNVVISPHIGGTTGDEVVRMADCVIEEYQAWAAGRPLRYQVTAEVLETMG